MAVLRVCLGSVLRALKHVPLSILAMPLLVSTNPENA
jgi:hypothetical protein